MKWEKSCGAVVFTEEQGQIQFVLVKQHHGRYGFPKGHVENDENEHQTAKREIKEETGLDIEFVEPFRMIEEYPVGGKQNTMKRVVYFLGKYENQKPTPQLEEISKIVVLPFKEALAKLEFEDKKKILQEADSVIHNNCVK